MATDAGSRRVVWLLDGLGLGGAERLALRFAAAAPAPWQVEVVGLRSLEDPGGLWGPEWTQLGAQLHQVGMRRLSDLAGWWRLLQLLRRLRPAVLHSHLRYATVWGGAAAQVLRLPHVTTVHVEPPRERGRARWTAGLERASRRRAARVIYVSQAQRAAWQRAGRAAGERAVVIANGVAAAPAPAPRAAARAARAVPASAWVLATVAVVRAAKGWRTWLGAVERIAPLRPDAWFVWVGGGPDYARLQEAAAASRWAGRIQLPGPQREVAAWLGLSDLFLFPSEQEAQPTAVLEAMAAGVAVVASALPAIREVVGAAACLVPPGDAAALAAAALRLGADGEQRRALAEVGRRRALEHFGEAQWRARLLALYTEVAGG